MTDIEYIIGELSALALENWNNPNYERLNGIAARLKIALAKRKEYESWAGAIITNNGKVQVIPFGEWEKMHYKGK